MIKAAMVTPSFKLGGAERWIVELIKHSDPARLQWTGVAISSYGGTDRCLATELSQFTRLFVNSPASKEALKAGHIFWPAIHEVTRPDFRDTVSAAAAGADVIVGWGLLDLGFWSEYCEIPRVLCTHSTLKEPENLPVVGVTHLAAVSELAMSYFDGRRGVDGLPRRVLYNGADPLRCRPLRSRQKTRAEWGLTDRDIVVGYLGRQSPEKNPLAPALAVASLPARYHAVYYGTISNGNGFCSQTVGWCKKRIPGRFHMFTPTPHVGDVLHGFDVLMLASHREAFSLTLIEAWLSGVPVVATPVGSIPELERRFGPLTFPVPLNPTPEDLRHAVELALTPSLRDDITERAREVAQEHFTVQAMADRWTAYLEDVVS